LEGSGEEKLDTSEIGQEAVLAEQAVASASDAIVTVDRSGVITSWNGAAESLLGHPPAAAIGQTLALVIPAAFRPRHIAGFHAAIESGSLRHHGNPVRIQAVNASGAVMPLAMTLGLLKGDGTEVRGVVAVLRKMEELEVFA
jgi:PAS domain S-box-containing protein